jgi:ADP-heptose:LPS heptosyltransferase
VPYPHPLPSGPYPVDDRAPRFLLILRLPLGDTLFVTPTIHALRQRYPRAQITALVAGTNAPLLAHNPDLNDTVVLPFHADWRAGGALPATLRCLLHRHYDVALCVSTPGLGWVAHACRIPRQEYLDFLPLWWLLPHDFSGWNRRHAVELYATVARRLDLPALERRTHVRVMPAERAAIAGVLHQLHRHGPALRIAIHPGSGAAPAQKRWPVERFVTVAQTLIAHTGASIFVVGGQSEQALAGHVARAVGPAAVSLAGHLNLRQTLALFQCCDLFIGNDSGPLHLASAVGTPAVGLYGATDPAVFGPWAPPQQSIVLQPPGAEPVIHFVGGDPIWRQIGATTRPNANLAGIPSSAVVEAARCLLDRTTEAVPAEAVR